MLNLNYHSYLENIITDQVINDFCENALEAFVDKLQIKN